ncbi:quorum sensing histidine kinase QseC [Pectobacterium wasabiae]|uniref:Sensor protein QseC n=1 Tax=Pectobacterium wasabiae TaxID=55208 RepID=A0AAW3ECP7_9GAMM|nr:quorum sensing histidine kinase QseC [Pectobacterium wasabiae]AOR63162.1 two-component system sensor histidine kinase QseC [Pectobacterium wasabiae CFBP 3304]EJS92072.1 Sensor protein QseC [Pectobacterium wasabiae CFBP 3304]KFX03586.1 sensor protein QseC [Pectobacterium wasabiae]KGA26937.1 sensor protein QseC [Pectobacterium wasabiae]
MSRLSLRLRLIVGFALLTVMCWSAASLLAWSQTRHNINELFDTQQMLFAKRLATMNPDELRIQSASLPKTKNLVHKNRGKQDDDALAFAIFTRDGKMVLNDGENGKDFIFDYKHNGFTDGKLRDDNDAWRIVWLTTQDDRYVIAVGQEWEYRQDMTLDIVKTNLMPWLFTLPIMLALLFWLVTRELSPLKRITAELQQRSPDDSTPLATQRIPQEVRPLVNALNLLFSRISDMLIRERRFTSDAAHELRSPLAALKVQTEVAQLAHDDEAMRRHALMNLDKGIDRATRLVDQLLTLSRLDAESHPEGMQPVQFNELLQQAAIAQYHIAQTAGIELTLDLPDTPVIRQGHPLLLTLLVRNLLDNAIRYSHEGGTVNLTLTERGFKVADSGPGISDEALARIGERFYRPPGQEKSGSGLGISIVNNIATLHHMQVTFTNQPEGGLIVSVSW